MLTAAAAVHVVMLSTAAGAAAAGSSSPAEIKWTATKPDCAKKELCGYALLPNRTKVEVYHATKEIGSYNHAAMMAYHDGRFLLTWKNSPKDEDSPGQRIMYSQSVDGLHWTATSDASNDWAPGGGHTGANVLFPNVSTAAKPARLFATPPVVINGRLYAGASPKQMCLFPDQYEPVLLLRQVYGNATAQLGPIFWAAGTIPAGFEAASSALGIRAVSEMDAQTQADVAVRAKFKRARCSLAPFIFSHQHQNRSFAKTGLTQIDTKSWEKRLLSAGVKSKLHQPS
jgi:hypothetical protein